MTHTLILSIAIGFLITIFFYILDIIKNYKLSYFYDINPKKLKYALIDLLCQIGLYYLTIISLKMFESTITFIALITNTLLFYSIYYYFSSLRYFLLNIAFLVSDPDTKNTISSMVLIPNKSIKIKMTKNHLPTIQYNLIFNSILISEKLVENIGNEAASLLITHKVLMNKYDNTKTLLFFTSLLIIPYTIVSQLTLEHLPDIFYGIFGVYVVFVYRILANDYFIKKLLYIDLQIATRAGKLKFLNALRSYYQYLNKQRNFQEIRNYTLYKKRIANINESK